MCVHKFYYENIVQRIYEENHKEHQGKLNMEKFHALDMRNFITFVLAVKLYRIICFVICLEYKYNFSDTRKLYRSNIGNEKCTLGWPRFLWKNKLCFESVDVL